MKRLNRVIAVAALATAGLCSGLRAQVLDQAPSSAIGVFEVKNLQSLSDKVAKFAKSLGVDQFQPKFADPLGSLIDETGLKEGVNKNGDFAIAMYNPKKGDQPVDMDKEPPIVILIPVDDYDAFLKNFKDAKPPQNDITEAKFTKSDDDKPVFIVHHGKYAAISPKVEYLSDHGGMKLTGPAAKEAEAKDAIFYVDLKSARPQIKKGYDDAMKEGRKQMADMVNQGTMQVPPFLLPLVDQFASRLIEGTNSAALSFNLTDSALSTAVIGDFEGESYVGKLVSQSKNTDAPLLAGLPDRPLWMYFGGTISSAVVNQLATDVGDIVKKNLPKDASADDIDKYVALVKKSAAAMKTTAGGAVVPGAGENYLQVVGVTKGDGPAIFDASKQSVAYAAMFSGMENNKMKLSAKLGEPTTVDGVKMQPYSMEVAGDANDPNTAQAKQLLQMMYGANGIGGAFGLVNNTTVITTQGAPQQLTADLIASAKADSDPLDKADNVKITSDQLPKQRVGVMYLALDNLATGVVAAMKQQGIPLQFKLPPNLPPIGVSISSEGSAARVDTVIPTKLVESITAAVMQAMMQGNGQQKGV
jgi:hypothetical protein